MTLRHAALVASVLASGTLTGAAGAGTGVVPWLGLRPPVAAAHPPLAPPCRAGRLRASIFLQGATGSLVGGIDLTNSGANACSLVGRPAVRLIGTAARRTRWRVRRVSPPTTQLDLLSDPPGSLRALRPGKTASIGITWSNWCGPGATARGGAGRAPSAIAIALASGTTVTLELRLAPRCDRPSAPSTLDVTPFVPAVRQLPESSRLPLRVAILGRRTVHVKPGLDAFRVRRGELFRFVVSVTNTGRRTFRFARTSCPLFVEQVGLGPQEVYVLDCRPAPLIPARSSVRFAMQIRIPSRIPSGVSSLTWQLAPKTYLAPFAPATLVVAR